MSSHFDPHIVHASAKVAKPAHPLQQGLRASWSLWLLYRLLILPALLSWLLPQAAALSADVSLDWLGGVVWQGLWLVPALLLTPWILQARSPYALLMSTLLVTIYLGASGVVLLSRWFDTGMVAWVVYSVDFLLLLLINVLVFNLLKRLPKMNA